MTDPKPYDLPKRRMLEAYWKVKATQGAAGIDYESIEMFETDLTGNVYKLWNRLSSGSYLPPPVMQVERCESRGSRTVLREAPDEIPGACFLEVMGQLWVAREVWGRVSHPA